MTRSGARLRQSSAQQVQEYYRTQASAEWTRLVKDPFHSELEFGMTLRYLREYLPRRGLILDAGGGPGRYTVELARRGYRVDLLDLVPEELALARRQIRKAGVQDRVEAVLEGTLLDLSCFADGSFDAVLCLGGPLSHLLELPARKKAVRELRRVAKRGAPLFVSVMGRLGVLEGYLAQYPEELETAPGDPKRILRTGDYLGGHGFTPCHFYEPDELDALLKGAGVRVLERVGLEGLATHREQKFGRLFRTRKPALKEWMKIHEATHTHPAVVATSHHFLFVCRKE